MRDYWELQDTVRKILERHGYRVPARLIRDILDEGIVGEQSTGYPVPDDDNENSLDIDITEDKSDLSLQIRSRKKDLGIKEVVVNGVRYVKS